MQEDLIHTRVWKGQSISSLEKIVAQNRNAFVPMQQCSAYFNFQLSNENTLVTYLLDAIQFSNPPTPGSNDISLEWYCSFRKDS